MFCKFEQATVNKAGFLSGADPVRKCKRGMKQKEEV